MRIQIGQQLGQYCVVGSVGAGGMGEVYRAHDSILDRDVALKVLPDIVADDPRRLARFEREARAAARVSHPNVIEIFDFKTEAGIAFAVIELLEGRTLREVIAGGTLGWRRAVEIAAMVSDGLSAIHGVDVVHRDIKPENIFLTADGRVKILDLGLARVAEPRSSVAETVSPDPALTEAGAVLGTAGYMAPEQVRGEETDSRSDIFALGCVLHEMITGVQAFRRETAAETMTAILREPPSALPSTITQEVPGLAGVVEHSLEKSPRQRYQSAADMAFALRSLLARPTEAVGPSGPVADADTPVGLKTLLLTDLVDSTGMLEALGDRRAFEVFGRHDKLARGLLVDFGGREIDKTDGFLHLFERSIDAVRYALAYHRALAELGREVGAELTARAGIHLGEVYLRSNSPEEVARGAKPLEVEGLAKPAAARLMSLAIGGQTLLTRGAFDLAARAARDTDLAGKDLAWLDHGHYGFKGIEEPVHVFEVGERGVAPLVPPPDSAKVQRVGPGAGPTSVPAVAPVSRSRWRPWHGIAALAALVVVAVIVGLLVVGRQEPPSGAEGPGHEPTTDVLAFLDGEPARRPLRERVAVLAFENLTGDPTHAPLVQGLPARLWASLAAVPDVEPVAAGQVAAALAEEHPGEPYAAVAAATRAGTIVSGSLLMEGESLRLQATVRDAVTGHLRAPVAASCASGKPTTACLDELCRLVSEQVEIQAHIGEQLLMMASPPTYEAYRAYFVDGDQERGLELHPALGMRQRLNASYARGNLDDKAGALAIARSVVEDEELLSPFGQQIARGALAMHQRNLLAALGYFRRAREIEPESEEARTFLVDAANFTNRPLESLSTWEGMHLCDTHGWKVNFALHLMGDFERELATARRLQECYPNVMIYRGQEVRALAALGRVSEVRAELEQLLAEPLQCKGYSLGSPGDIMRVAALELGARGEVQAARELGSRAAGWWGRVMVQHAAPMGDIDALKAELILAQILRIAEQHAEAGKLLERLAAANPGDSEVLGELGALAATGGDRDRAESIDAALAEIRDPYQLAAVNLGRARIQARLGRSDRAVELISRSLAAGYGGERSDFVSLRTDFDLQSLRANPAFIELLRPKG